MKQIDLPAILLIGAAFSSTPATAQQSGMNNVVLLRGAAYCDPTEPGVSVAELQWPVSIQGAGKSELKSSVGLQDIEVTTFKDGFKRGLYGSLKASEERDSSVQRRPDTSGSVPGLDHLQISTMSGPGQEPAKALRLQAMAPFAGRESVIIKINGLVPGMRYFWRVSSPGSNYQETAITAAVCPVDLD